MDLRVLFIHGDRPLDSLYKTLLVAAEPAIEVSFAQTLEEVQSYPQPQIILLDLDLVRPSSLEILEWLRSEKTYRGIPVFVLSSSKTADRIDKAYELGANSCVMKSENGGLRDEVARGIGSYARVLQISSSTA